MKKLLLSCLCFLGMTSLSAQDSYKLVETQADLTSGDQYIVVATSSDTYYAMGEPSNTTKASARVGKEISAPVDKQVTISSTDEVVPVTIDYDGSSYTFQVSDNSYISFTGISNNNMYVANSESTNINFTIEVGNNGACTIKSTTYKARGLRFNPSAKYFSNYSATTQQAVYLYKLATVTSVDAPTFSVAAGEVEMGTQVSLSCTTANAKIYYTTNGAPPTSASTPYSEPIVISEDMTIKAIAYVGNVSSNVVSATYTVLVEEPTGVVDVDVKAEEGQLFNEPFDLTFETGSGDVVKYIICDMSNYEDIQDVLIDAIIEGDESMLDEYITGTSFNGGKVEINKGCLFMAWSEGFLGFETMVMQSYAFQFYAPVITPEDKEDLLKYPTVTITANEVYADTEKFNYEIKYTLDGTDPRESATAVVYTAPFVPDVTTDIVSVKAALVGDEYTWGSSEVTEVIYSLADLSDSFTLVKAGSKFYPGDQVMFLGYGYNTNGQALSLMAEELTNKEVSKVVNLDWTTTQYAGGALEIPEYLMPEEGVLVATLEKHGDKVALKVAEDKYLNSDRGDNKMTYGEYKGDYSDVTITVNAGVKDKTQTVPVDEIKVQFTNGGTYTNSKGVTSTCLYFGFNYNNAVDNNGNYTESERFSIYSSESQGSSRTFMYVKNITKTVYWDNANGATFTGDPYVFFSLDGGVTFEEEAVKMEEHVAPAAAPARAEGESTPAVITHEAAIPSSATHLYFAESNDGEHFTNATNQFEATHGLIYDGQDTTGIENVTVVESNEAAPVEYYNLQGVRVDNPVKGIYIMRQGNKAVKVVK